MCFFSSVLVQQRQLGLTIFFLTLSADGRSHCELCHCYPQSQMEDEQWTYINIYGKWQHNTILIADRSLSTHLI